jgi:hypothetical protein
VEPSKTNRSISCSLSRTIKGYKMLHPIINWRTTWSSTYGQSRANPIDKAVIPIFMKKNVFFSFLIIFQLRMQVFWRANSYSSDKKLIQKDDMRVENRKKSSW